MELDPRRLRILLAIARHGGVLAAADELGVTASSISQQLGKLEQEAGHALVVRTPKGTVLTNAGLAAAEAAEEIERVLNVARARIEEGTAEPHGEVRVGGFASFLRTVLVPRLPAWREQFPRLAISVIEDDYPALMRMLRRRELDAVAVELDAHQDAGGRLPLGVSEEPLLDEPWRLVVPSGALATAEGVDLSRLPVPWLGVDASAAGASAVERLRRVAGVESESVHRYLETSTALAMVAAGEGVTVLPVLALYGQVQEGVEALDVPGLGTRRIVLRRVDRGGVASTPVDTVVRLVRESISALDLEALSDA